MNKKGQIYHEAGTISTIILEYETVFQLFSFLRDGGSLRGFFLIFPSTIVPTPKAKLYQLPNILIIHLENRKMTAG